MSQFEGHKIHRTKILLQFRNVIQRNFWICRDVRGAIEQETRMSNMFRKPWSGTYEQIATIGSESFENLPLQGIH